VAARSQDGYDVTMHPSLVIRVPASSGPTRNAFDKVLKAGEFQDASDPEWDELISESRKYEVEGASPVRINLYRDDAVAGRHSRYTFEFVGDDEKAVAKVRDEFSETLTAHRLHAAK
jgi:hypothetical protein